MKSETTALIIIGNGIAGITAARTVRKLHPEIQIKIISEETDYFFSRTALMYIYMGHMRARDTEPYARDFYQKNRLELIRDRVTQVDTDTSCVHLQSGGSLFYNFLLITSGAKPNKFGWPGQDLPRVQGMYSMQDLEGLEAVTNKKNHLVRRATIVGGGLIGIELAEMLHTRHIPVTMLVRENSYWKNILPPAESQMVNNEIREHGIDLRLETELKEILPAEDGGAGAAITNQGDKIVSEFIGLTAGVSPNINFLKQSKVETARGVLVNHALQTSIRGIYAAGDCVQFRKPDGNPGPVEQLWYTGRMHGEVVGRQIVHAAFLKEGRQTEADSIDTGAYERGIWYNSAKLFTIEYHTYGMVPAQLEANFTHVWQDPDPKSKILIRLVWEMHNGTACLTGMNSLGVRFRHRVFEAWLSDRRDIDYVVDHLGEAQFDPEFFKHKFRDFQADFRKRFPGGLAAIA